MAPDVCTLPTDEQPLRVAEFDTLFRTCLHEVQRRSATTLRLNFEGPDDLVDRVKDLTDRETQCCSFFAFTIRVEAGSRVGRTSVQLDVEVPPGRSAILTAVAQGAETALREGPST